MYATMDTLRVFFVGTGDPIYAGNVFHLLLAYENLGKFSGSPWLPCTGHPRGSRAHDSDWFNSMAPLVERKDRGTPVQVVPG